jgi:hypothetical protein
VLLGESRFKPIYALQDCFSFLEPDSHVSGPRLAELKIGVNVEVVDSIVKHYQFREEVLTKEVNFFSDFPTMKAKHQEKVDMFLSSQLQMRRQVALQKEIDERIIRLNDLRAIRMEAVRTLREQLKEEERLKQEEADRKAQIPKKGLSQMVSKREKECERVRE